MSTQDEHKAMILDCEKRESQLNDWESNFLVSMTSRVESRGLSSNEDRVLTEIWDRVTENG